VKTLNARPGFQVNPSGFVAYSPAPGIVQLEWNAVTGAEFYWLQGPGLTTPLKTQLTFSKIVDVPVGTHTYTLLSVFAEDIAPDESNPSRATVAVAESAEMAIERAYVDGRQMFGPGPDPEPGLWKATARATGAGYDVLIESFKSIWLVAYAYHHLLARVPDTEGAAKYIGRLNTGTPWTDVWREIAHSSERDQKYGYWAPAPINSVDDARAIFGNSLVHAESCFGGIGDQCDTADVGDPTWSTGFRLPDGALMAYVTVNVAVGSILHDNACIASRGTGYYCDQTLFYGFVAADLLSSVDPITAAAKAMMPAVLEWNKAVYNSVQKRLWRETFGPYPVHRETRRQYWYDDVRPTSARKAHMAPMFGIITAPTNVIRYAGLETKSSRRLSAPSQTWLDIGDEEFCKSKQWSTNLILWAQCK
jgi:hypothetical protein